MGLLKASSIQLHLSTQSQTCVKSIYTFDVLSSTNSWLLEHGHCNAACLAEIQTQGRGRRGNVWESTDNGNIYLSLSWCFTDIPKHLSLLSLMVGISLCETLQALGLQQHGLKWPNDIYVNNRKLAGILVETSDNLHRVVVGIGLNINNSSQTERCGLEDFLDDSVDINNLAAQILNGLVAKLDTIDTFSFDTFNQQWRQWDVVLNKPVFLIEKCHKNEGIARGINEAGQIILEEVNGTLNSYHSAEVSLRW